MFYYFPFSGTSGYRKTCGHFHRNVPSAANSIFGKIGRIASEDVLIELLKIDFVVNRFFMKLFRTSDISVITYLIDTTLYY